MGMFADYDPEDIRDEVVDYIEEAIGEELPDGDERLIFAEALVAYLVAERSDVEDRASQRFLADARGEVLDAIGEMYGCERRLAQAASCTLRFSVAAALPHDVAVPLGTMASTPDGVEFATVEAGAIAAGSLSCDVRAEAIDEGGDANGIPAGSVTVIEDALAEVESVTSLGETAGGSDGELDDEDGNAAYRERIKLAMNAISTAGTAASYRYHAMRARDDVADAQAVEPTTPCEITVYVLKSGGGDFSDAELAEVQAAVSADDVRPLGDRVTAVRAEADDYALSVSYTCDDASAAATVEAIEGDGGAIDSYVEWQMGAIGRDVNPQRLMALMFAAGATGVDVQSPAASETADGHYARCASRSVTRTGA